MSTRHNPNSVDLPKVVLPGSEGYWDAYDKGNEMDALWPGQDATDFAYAVGYNDKGPLAEHGIAGLLMLQQGENDGGAWVWLVRLDNGEHWLCEGSCDYTGWDCQSGNEWARWEPADG